VNAPKPFTTWNGEKQYDVWPHLHLLPDALKNGKLKTMVFPFLGDGTAFVRLASRFPVKETILIDSNPDLIHAYRYIKEHPADIIRELEKLLRHYWTTPNGQKQLMCEEMRHLYDMRALSELGLAVCYIFLQMPLRYGSCVEKAATTSLVDDNREG